MFNRYTNLRVATLFLLSFLISCSPVAKADFLINPYTLETAGGGATPVVETTANTAEAGNSSSHSISMPTSIAVGDLIIVFFGHSRTAGVSVDTGVSGFNWIELDETLFPVSSVKDTAAVYWKTAEGSDALTLTTSASHRSTAISYRISGASTVTYDIALSVGAGNPDPPSHDAGSSKNFLWLVAAMTQEGDWPTTLPANYTNLLQEQDGGLGTSVTSGRRELATQIENPDAFTGGLTTENAAYTIAVHP